jgi:hypothetical protein
MHDLSNTIYRYYVNRSAELSPPARFHFVSRLYLWNRDPACQKLLADSRPWFTHNDQPEEAIRQVIEDSRLSASHGSKNAAGLRRPYFNKYPQLKTYVSALFRINFLQTVYGLDARELFFRFFDKAKTESFARELARDDDAVRILSTHAVNFFYLYNGLILDDASKVDPEAIYGLGRTGYDLENPVHLQLRIYLYTHCIIGDSLFYYRAVPAERLGIYKSMLDRLEELIGTNFTGINLDNKFEFLVCAAMAGKQTPLKERIFDEAKASLSHEGSFLIDKHNSNPQLNNTNLEMSEHRNVLFIMANRPFKPVG